jgi:CRP-like cAMP-binding protein
MTPLSSALQSVDCVREALTSALSLTPEAIARGLETQAEKERRVATKLQRLYRQHQAALELNTRRNQHLLQVLNFNKIQRRMRDVLSMNEQTHNAQALRGRKKSVIAHKQSKLMMDDQAAGVVHVGDSRRDDVMMVPVGKAAVSHAEVTLFSGNYVIKRCSVYVSILESESGLHPNLRASVLYYKTKTRYSFHILQAEWAQTGFGALAALGQDAKQALCRAIVDGMMKSELETCAELQKHNAWMAVVPGLRHQVDPGTLLELLGKMEERKVTDKTTIIHQGALADGMFFLRSGTIKVIEGTLLKDLVEGPTFFGETGCLTGAQRTSTVVAVTDCDLLFLPRMEFEDACKKIPSFCANVGVRPGSVLLKWVSIIPGIRSHFTQQQQHNLVGNMTKKTFSAGRNIIKHGSDGDGMFFLLTGSVTIKERGQTGHTVTAPSFFGEGGLSTASKRHADVTATSKSTVLFLKLADYKRICEHYPGFCDTAAGVVRPNSFSTDNAAVASAAQGLINFGNQPSAGGVKKQGRRWGAMREGVAARKAGTGRRSQESSPATSPCSGTRRLAPLPHADSHGKGTSKRTSLQHHHHHRHSRGTAAPLPLPL